MSTIWIFGYGSLIWRPEINYTDAKIGYITGYKRRFFQGSASHRGSPTKLGRVVTLLKDDENPTNKVWGRAYCISADDAAALAYLNDREEGYTTYKMTFHTVASTKQQHQPNDDTNCVPSTNTFQVLAYVALPENDLFLGDPGSVQEIAREICHASGASGHNVEYFARLAAFHRWHLQTQFAAEPDSHLEELEPHVRELLTSSKSPALAYFDEALLFYLNQSASAHPMLQTSTLPVANELKRQKTKKDSNEASSLLVNNNRLNNQINKPNEQLISEILALLSQNRAHLDLIPSHYHSLLNLQHHLHHLPATAAAAATSSHQVSQLVASKSTT